LSLEAKKFAAAKYQLKTFKSAYRISPTSTKERVPRQLRWASSSNDQENNIETIAAKKTTAHYKEDEFFRSPFLNNKKQMS